MKSVRGDIIDHVCTDCGDRIVAPRGMMELALLSHWEYKHK